ncbi:MULTISPECIES: hypothetical protein [Methylomicrobium]|uniref:Tryptophan synthase subunit beta like protein n=1 Tax=Methylomicrobium album BG8 TaxID=686340 RepID=H8GIU1_METAL|nr:MULTISPECIES: hypothetical protein [Methylomicrobium]EIC30281.1 hypothetical protein Metal_2565 [Methylomicrobium album BG8]
MPYISRNGAGEIIGLHHSPPEAEAEWLDGDDAQIQQFLLSCAPTEQTRRSLSDSDSDMIRVIEDLIELLIAKNVFTFTELPEAVQRKLGSRRRLREDLGMLANLVDKDDRIF